MGEHGRRSHRERRAVAARARDPIAAGRNLPPSDLLRALDQGNLEVIEEIAPRDFLHRAKPETYFFTGRSALRCIALAMLAARKPTVSNILDFPSGYGRVLRALKAAFPEAKLTACDIKEDAIQFCADVFGATPVLSRESPSEVEIAGEFDLIWCGSLLTHVDSDRWIQFLELFDSLLSSDGILVFTAAGRHVVERMKEGETSRLTPEQIRALVDDYERTGFGFRANPEDGVLGLARASPAWVCSQLERLPRLRILTYTERGWNERQDVVACVPVDGPPDPRN